MIKFTEKAYFKNQKYNIEIHDNSVFKPPVRNPTNRGPTVQQNNQKKGIFPSLNLNLNINNLREKNKPTENERSVDALQNKVFKMNIVTENPPEPIDPRQNLKFLAEKYNIPYPIEQSYNSIVPLKIYQTWFSKELPTNIGKSVKNIKEMNPEFEHYLYDDNDCRTFISNNFEMDVVEAFDRLVPGAYKADLWRYCVLYINGGIYLDVKYKCVNGFRLIALTDKEWLVKDLDTSGGGVYNALMITKPNNPLYLSFINKVVENVKNRYYGDNSLMPTGPHMVKQFLSSDTINELFLTHLELDEYYIMDKRYNIIILKIDENYRLEQKNNTNNKKHYSTMWHNKEIYI